MLPTTHCQEGAVLSITTDYVEDTGCPEPYLQRIADAGFTHIHWCHHWNTDFLYSRPEIEQIALWLRDFGLCMTDLHASAGREKAWGAVREYERLAGVELVKNRLEMAARLAGDVVIMHLPGGPADGWWPQIRRSLDELQPYAEVHGVRIALENGGSDESFDDIERVLEEYAPDYLGLCYDSGHANRFEGGLRRFEKLKDRLISVHLHDNDGTGDQHNLVFSGTIDWPRVAVTIASSSYDKCISMEVTMRNSGIDDEETFLKRAFETGTTLAQMVNEHR
jgi:sugar phosphate isomerase/epimerase